MVRDASLVAALAAIAYGTTVATPVRADVAAAVLCTRIAQTVPVLTSPRDGASGVAPDIGSIVISIPHEPSTGAPSLGEQRLVLVASDASRTEAAAFHPASRAGLAEGTPVAGSALNAGDLRFASTVIPTLRASTQYTVRLELPAERGCVYVTLGSFTTRRTE